MNIDISSRFLCLVEPLYQRLVDFSVGSVTNDMVQLARTRLHAKFTTPGWPWPESYYNDKVNLKSPPDCVVGGEIGYILTPVEETVARLRGGHAKSAEAIASILPSERFEHIMTASSQEEHYVVTVNKIKLEGDDIFVVMEDTNTTTQLRLTFWDTTGPLTERISFSAIEYITDAFDYRIGFQELWSSLSTGVYSLELHLTPHFVIDKMRLVRNYNVKLTY